MINTVNEEVVKDILRNKEKKIKNIHKKMLALYRELEASEDMRARDVLPAIRTDGMPGVKGRHKDLGDILLGYQRQQCERNEEIRKMMWALSEQEETISRVWACFYALDDPYYSILQALYVENQLYQAVENSFDISHKTFEKYRQHGISLIMGFYESGESIADLMRRHQTEAVSKKKSMAKKEAENAEYGQISLMGYLAEEGGEKDVY